MHEKPAKGDVLPHRAGSLFSIFEYTFSANSSCAAPCTQPVAFAQTENSRLRALLRALKRERIERFSINC